jgi:hypothetical protein
MSSRRGQKRLFGSIEDIGRGLLQGIIKDTKLTKEKFLKYQN